MVLDLFERTVETYLNLYMPTFIDLYLLKTDYPREYRICLKVKYDRCELKFGSYGPSYERVIYVFNPRGIIELKKAESNEWIKIAVKEILPRRIENPCRSEISICSKSLSISELHEIAEKVRGESIDVRWSFEAYGYIPPNELCYTIRRLTTKENIRVDILPTSFIVVRGEGVPSKVDYVKFVKSVIVPAELIERVFIEVPLEPLSEDVFQRIKDSSVRKALKILFEKQKILREALEEYRRALTASDYRDVISRVRGAVEHLTLERDLGKKVFGVLRKALEDLNIIEEIPAGSSARAREIDEIIKTLDNLSYVIFKLASKLGAHQQDYRSRPYVHDAELVLHIALNFMNYLIRVLLRYAYRA